MKLNEKGQCPVCLVKPVPYKGTGWRSATREKFCCRCDRTFNYDTGEFMENWAWSAPNTSKKKVTKFERYEKS